MQESRKNVVQLSQYGRGRASSGAPGGSLLDACGEMAATWLGDALAKTLKRSADELLELVDQLPAYEMRRLYDEAREFARAQGDATASDLKRQFFARFKRECRRDKARGSGSQLGGLDASQLTLMDPDDLEESLAAGTVANAINNVCGEELFGLSKRMGILLDDPELQYGDNPVSPEIIGDVVTEALKARELPFKTRLVLIPLINKHLPMLVRELYQALNRHLVEQNVLPTIRVGGRRPDAPPDAPPAREASAVAGSEVDEQDILSLLRKLLSNQAGAMPAAATPAKLEMPAAMASLLAGDTAAGPASPAGAPLPPTDIAEAAPVVMRALTQLQKGQLDTLPGITIDPGRLQDGHVNILREIKTTEVAGNMGQMDAMTLDIVALIFDYILDDRRIPDAMKALIGRLQIPVLKVAMLDRAFFSLKTHPARRLLDVLAEASMGWDEAEGHESGLYRKVDDLVQRILNQFDEEVDVFNQALEEFSEYQVEEKRRADELAGRSARVIQSREQTALARIVARDEVQSHLFDQPVAEFIRAFLSGPWEQRLAHVYARDGENSDAWRETVATMDDLIWSVTPKISADDRKKLVGLLPDLLRRLDQGLRDLGVVAEIKDQFFTGLVKCHAEAVRAGLRAPGDGPGIGAIPVPSFDLAEPTSDEAESTDGFVTIPAPDDSVEADPELVREIAAEPEERPLVEEITIGDVGWLARGHEEPEIDEFEARVRQLKRGSWIEYRDEAGEMVRAKLAWISPLKGIYLFTNRLGQRAMSINGEGLAAKFREGQVQLIDNVPLMDRAVNSLLEKLQQNAA